LKKTKKLINNKLDNIVAEDIEKLGVRTFSTQEMAFNILGLMHISIAQVILFFEKKKSKRKLNLINHFFFCFFFLIPSCHKLNPFGQI